MTPPPHSIINSDSASNDTQIGQSNKTNFKTENTVISLSQLEDDFDYETFLRRMKHPDCRPLIVLIKAFLKRFKQRSMLLNQRYISTAIPSSFAGKDELGSDDIAATKSEMVLPSIQLTMMYRDFLDTIMDAIKENPVWRLAADSHQTISGIDGKDDSALTSDPIDQMSKPSLSILGNPHKNNPVHELAREGIEYLLMNQLYAITFNPLEDQSKDDLIGGKMFMLNEWIEPRHLDIPIELLLLTDCKVNDRPNNDPDSPGSSHHNSTLLLSRAISEFNRVNEYITPRDKLICLLGGCHLVQILTNCLLQKCNDVTESNDIVSEERLTDEKLTMVIGADDLMPILIYTIIKACPAHFYSTLQYISRYRSPSRLIGAEEIVTASSSVGRGTEAYHFTNLLAVCAFIERTNEKSLALDSPDEYARKMAIAQMRWSERKKNQNNVIENDLNSSPHSPPVSPSLADRWRDPESREVELERLKEGANRVITTVKEKLKKGANRSMSTIGKWMDEAEAAINKALNPSITNGSIDEDGEDDAGELTPRMKNRLEAIMKGDPNQDVQLSEEERQKFLEAEEEYQLQLALAISLSESIAIGPKQGDAEQQRLQNLQSGDQDGAPLISIVPDETL